MDLNNDNNLDLFISSQGREVGGPDGYNNAPDQVNPMGRQPATHRVIRWLGRE